MDDHRIQLAGRPAGRADEPSLHIEAVALPLHAAHVDVYGKRVVIVGDRDHLRYGARDDLWRVTEIFDHRSTHPAIRAERDATVRSVGRDGFAPQRPRRALSDIDRNQRRTIDHDRRSIELLAAPENRIE